ncbi:MAG TPA: glycosyltransferase family 39 protein [Candidatus Nanopelagicales bacterium]
MMPQTVRPSVGPGQIVAEPVRAPLTPWAWAVAGVMFVALLATASRYGYHRDELYFIQAGAHPAFGYPDQPPLVPLLCQAMQALAPGSLVLLRLPSALIAASTVVVAALTAREIGGTSRAQLIAASCTAASAFALATGHFVTTTTVDLLSTTLLIWLVIRVVATGSARPLLWAGVVVGLGAEAKPQVAFVALVLIVALTLVGPRWPLRSRWALAGIGVAVILAAPYLLWQALNGWPQLTVAGNVAGSAEGGRAGFLPFQLVLVSPLLSVVWIVGLVALFRSLRAYRFLAVTYLLVAAAYLVGNGKAYYLASLYPALLAAGALPIDRWLSRGHARVRAIAASVVIVISAAVSAVVALPLLPASSLNGSAVLALNPDQGETVGWPDFVSTVASVWHGLPTGAVIFADNYGEAGAIDLFGPAKGLPAAYSGHNGFSSWGQPPGSRGPVIVLGFDPADAAQYFRGCNITATITNASGVHNDEYDGPVLVCSAPRASWSALWSQLTHYN